MRLKLTKQIVDRLSPTDKPYEVFDTELAGLVFRIEASGRRSWYFAYRIGGLRRRFRIGSHPGVACEAARREATKLAGKVAANVDPQAELTQSRVRAERERVSTLKTFLAERYEPWAETHLKTAKEQLARIKSDFAPWMERPLSGLTPFLIENWRRAEVKRGKKPVTANRDLQRLGALVSKAVAWRVLDSHPFREVKPLRVDKRGRVRYLSAEEERRLRQALIDRETSLRDARDRFNEWRECRHYKTLPPRTGEFVDHVRPLTLLALNTGMRRGELLALAWADVDLIVKQLTVRGRNAKSAQTRNVPLNSEAMRVITAWRELRLPAEPADCVFGHRNGEAMAGIASAWETVKDVSGLPDFRFHDCRHHFASRLVMAGVPLNTVRDLLGHASIEMTMRYAHLAPETLAQAVEKLSAAG
jgi:integrase